MTQIKVSLERRGFAIDVNILAHNQSGTKSVWALRGRE